MKKNFALMFSLVLLGNILASQIQYGLFPFTEIYSIYRRFLV